MRSMVGRASLLLLGSGFCALVYQTAWLRMFRLVFGASTASSAAVLAIFMAGLGFGGLLLGRRADRQASPLGFYGNLEIGIAVAAGLSPWLVAGVEWLYIAMGGSGNLGAAGGTVVRLLLSTLVLGLPTFLMGGTLPAVARAVEQASDQGRRAVGLLYAVNTIGAVVGTLVTTFYALELLGIRKSIWIAALLNLLVALAARSMARTAAPVPVAAGPALEEETDETAAAETPGTREGRRLAPLAAALVGFAFLLMELVWYRMMGPLLGGSSYTFGLILAVALLGIGAGGLLYGAGPLKRRPTLLAFAATCSLEAFFIALPFAMGDRIAVLAAMLRPLSGAGFGSLVLAWTAITAVVVLPAALVAGYQFPLLIALLGSGRKEVGREVGLTYAANTVGAILGSIAGGFGLIPLMSAPGVWRLVVILLLALAGLAVAAALRSGSPFRAAAAPLAVGAVALFFSLLPGPTAFWRHSPIGAGRIRADWRGPNDMQSTLHTRRRGILWERDGVESSVALEGKRELAFLVNGKADGSARTDAPTQIMSGLVGAILHPDPRRSLVIGLGTGSTAGWLAAVPTMERVDVVELEPAVVDVARACEPVNHQALADPKVLLVLGDGRELLLTTGARYDIIFSEPSNPYRAGIASLFTVDFYQAARQRLRPNGMFLQWLQGYELDAQVVRTVYATLAAVFPYVETWEVNAGDLLLMASMEPVAHDVGLVRARAVQEPYRSALSRTWGVGGAEGYYTGYLASSAFARAVAESEGQWVNTDDRPILEFGFARNLGRTGLFESTDLARLAQDRGEDRPALRNGTLDPALLQDLRIARAAFWERNPADPAPGADPALAARIRARQSYLYPSMTQACAHWFSQPEPPRSDLDVLLVSECLASRGDARMLEYVPRLEQRSPTEAALVLSLFHASTGQRDLARYHLTAAIQAFRTDPWPFLPMAERILTFEMRRSQGDPDGTLVLMRELEKPFAVNLLDEGRQLMRLDLARVLGRPELCVEALAPLEPNVPWEEPLLRQRYQCYKLANHRLEGRALRDLEDFLANAPPSLEEGLPAPKSR